jgi:phytoene dehydrogenase-like protein
MGEIDGAFRAWGIPKGGTGGISNAIASAARANGAEIRTEAPVARIRVGGGRASGVVLESGEELEASTVLSTVDVRRTFIDLIEPGTVDPKFEAEVRRFKFRGSSGKVNMALDALPSFTALPGEGEHLRGAISFSPSMAEMERAYDDAKYGRFSAKPYIDIIIPTLVDPSMAPPGKHIMSCFVQYAPYNLDPSLGGWDAQREAFGDAVVNRIAEFAPDLPSKILHRNVQTPLDIERTTGLTEGNIFQGELSLEQLFFSRPVPGWARFRTPIKDLWLCGSSTHPGGGIMGANGRIAALELLRSKRRRP